MKISKYKIQNYRAIDEIIINLNYSINPIIGVNESGKTSILHALLAFDKNRDKVNGGVQLEYQNKYITKDTTDCKISAYITFSNNDLKELGHALGMKTGSNDYKEFERFTDKTEFILRRELSDDDMKYSLDNDTLSEKTLKKFIKFLQKKLPFILYFDDFTDRVPDEISFKEDYKTTGKIAFSKNKEWQEIVVEIFRKADVDGIDNEESPLKSFFLLEDKDRKGDILSDIEGILNREIIDEWKKIKKSGHKNFADDSENLSIQLNCEDNTFRFKIKDQSNQNKKRTFNVSERSKGFQWFFNYMIKLKFNPRYKGTPENSIFLLDEPGSYLHSSAQSELLDELKTVSKKNIIIYCTHSQYLLNPKIIKLGSIKIAKKIDSKVTLTKYGDYKEKDDKGALSAVYQALRLNFTNDFVGKIVITEGITDRYFFEMLKSFTGLLKTEFRIIPGAGSGNSSNLISIGISFSEDFVVLFDNDRGKSAIKKYEEEFGQEINRHFHIYGENIKHKFRLEDFLSKEDKKRIFNTTKTNDLKKALAVLYYDCSESDKKFVFENLNFKSLDLLKETISRLNAL